MIKQAFLDFIGQPWGVAGALCIMAGVTIFNRPTIPRDRAGLLLNIFNLFGGIFLLTNAVIRDEIVWIVLEVYFVIIAAKGYLLSRKLMKSRKDGVTGT